MYREGKLLDLFDPGRPDTPDSYHRGSVLMAESDVTGKALEFADESLKADREVVLEALRGDADALEYASEELQNDPELKKLDEF